MSSVAEKLQKKSQRQSVNKQVRLRLVYIDFWSAVKLSFLAGIALGVVLVVATVLIWILLNSLGLFGALDGILADILASDETFSVTGTFGLAQVAIFAVVVAVLNAVVGTAIGAIVALLYNFSVKMTGGLLVGFTNN
jgi:hypothetical protein